MISSNQMNTFKATFERAYQKSSFYHKKLSDAGIYLEDLREPEDFEKLPFTTKEELRDAYPLKIQAVSDEEIVRIHSSSGTTGKPIIIPYTANDVEDWALMMKRCLNMAGITKKDRVQITPGYGLWTAGIGFQAGVEKMGAMAVPMGPGNTQKQLQMMRDLESTTIIATSSYALLLAEEIEKEGLREKIRLRKGIIGSERWGDKMRHTIKETLGIELYDIYGLTEIYGPGISMSCSKGEGLHYWDDYLYFEIIDPETLKPVPEGELGELVITTLTKEGAPLIRYRTRDITRLILEKCPCGCSYPRHDRILGRTDDMIKIKGVNIYPGQIEDLLKVIEGVGSEYRIILDHKEGKDHLTIQFEVERAKDLEALAIEVKRYFKSKIGIGVYAVGVPAGTLPRSEKKTQRVIDQRIL
ncbi:MAG: phenylacetate--CoA ligase family protein [Cellulosilyticaceae bacterium]